MGCRCTLGQETRWHCVGVCGESQGQHVCNAGAAREREEVRSSAAVRGCSTQAEQARAAAVACACAC
eukprot:scaffold217251_cov19-Tisochrysis_lutea.AAC.1